MTHQHVRTIQSVGNGSSMIPCYCKRMREVSRCVRRPIQLCACYLELNEFQNDKAKQNDNWKAFRLFTAGTLSVFLSTLCNCCRHSGVRRLLRWHGEKQDPGFPMASAHLLMLVLWSAVCVSSVCPGCGRPGSGCKVELNSLFVCLIA